MERLLHMVVFIISAAGIMSCSIFLSIFPLS